MILSDSTIAFLRFPVNVVLALLWITFIWIGYREWKSRKIIRLLSSPSCTILSIILFIAACLVMGLFPQLSPTSAAMQTGFCASLGCYRVSTSPLFLAILLLLMTNLGFVIMRRFDKVQAHRIRFTLNHVGLWLVLFAGFFGSTDTQSLRLPAYSGLTSRKAYTEAGVPTILSYPINLRSFHTDYYSNGMPSHFTARASIGKEDAILEVNRPYHYNLSDDIYLASIEGTDSGPESGYCILQIVHQPWRYVTLLGIIMMAGGAALLFMQGSKKKEGGIL